MELLDPRIPVRELVTLLEDLELPVAFGADVAAFAAVEVFDLTDIKKAFDELLVYEDRAAFVILEKIEHSNEANGGNLTIGRALQVTVAFTDRRYVDRIKAMMGDDTPAPDAIPGCLLIQTLMVDAMAGKMPTCNCMLLPGLGHLTQLQGADRSNDTGRIIFLQEFDITLGSETVSRPGRRKSRLAR